ncbi:MAG: DUF6776 family protein [Tahibacter sp.]
MARTTPYPQLVVREHEPARLRRRVLMLAACWLLSVAAAAILSIQFFSRIQRTGPDPAEFKALQEQSESLKQHVAVLERADQVDRVASSDLQQSLREREEEIAGLRADLAFYSRLVGGSARREGLAVHSVRVASVKNSRAWNVTVTLTQNVKRSQVSDGKVQLSIDGVMGGQLKTLGWSDLADAARAAGLPFSFKYFQQVSGTVMLPDGFSPNRIKVVVDSGSEGGRVEQGFAWAEAQATEESSNVQ